jgi:hypothetical protein
LVLLRDKKVVGVFVHWCAASSLVIVRVVALAISLISSAIHNTGNNRN